MDEILLSRIRKEAYEQGYQDGMVEGYNLAGAKLIKRKKGKWIVIMSEPNITFDECKCSECGVIECFNKGWKKFNFCPNCGARMEGYDG